ncbi:unnamed protein product [Polarella glacialis]|uniref:CSD domain-containing protein n=1 Tax=Polarella glacialis TaxID=89957 RepID=A0A813LUF0_POLGL|nr:unnamed protein product [Polarella glacialis]CAE8735273.1 unnamed protein product [Polarella glacialis]
MTTSQVSCAELGSDALLLKSQLNGFAVDKGDKVAFSVKDTERGPQAVDVKVLGDEEGSQWFIGQLKTWNEAKGFGFIASPGAEAALGKEVFVMKSQFANGARILGAAVQFQAKMNDRGPVVIGEVKLKVSPGMQGMMPGMMPAMMPGMMQGMMPRMMMPAMMPGMMPRMMSAVPAATASLPSQTFLGTLKSVSEKGWGHITCPAMKNINPANEDIMVLKTGLEAVPGISTGTKVTFSVTAGSKGPHATNLSIVQDVSPHQRYLGKVLSFNDGKGYGFIECSEAKAVFQSDVFLHKKELQGVAVNIGDEVEFSVDVQHSGRAAASNVTILGAGSSAAAAATAAVRHRAPARPSVAPHLRSSPY